MVEAVLLIFISLINIALWIVFSFRFKKRFSPEIMLADIKREVDKLLIEINRTVDRDITLVESRLSDLRVLTESADARLRLLEKEKSDREREQRVLKKLAETKPPVQKYQAPPSSARSVAPDTSSAVEKYKTMQSDADESGVQLSIDFDAYRNTEEPEITAPAPEEPPVKDKVIKLYFQGLSVDLICKQLNLSVSEAQFIIDTFAG